MSKRYLVTFMDDTTEDYGPKDRGVEYTQNWMIISFKEGSCLRLNINTIKHVLEYRNEEEKE